MDVKGRTWTSIHELSADVLTFQEYCFQVKASTLSFQRVAVLFEERRLRINELIEKTMTVFFVFFYICVCPYLHLDISDY